MQTFRLIDVDEASAEMADTIGLGVVTELPEITEHHALVADGDGAALVCAHDTANGTSRRFTIPAELTELMAADDPPVEVFQDRIGDHLNRLARAVFN